MLIDLLQTARRSVLSVKHMRIGGGGIGQNIRGGLLGVGLHFVEKIARAAGAEEMREIEFGAPDLAADIAAEAVGSLRKFKIACRQLVSFTCAVPLLSTCIWSA